MTDRPTQPGPDFGSGPVPGPGPGSVSGPVPGPVSGAVPGPGADPKPLDPPGPIPTPPGAAAPSEGPQPRRREKRPDKWAHRRGEPRVFAFFWTLYLLGATLLGFAALGLVGGITADIYRPVARGIIVTVAIGATLLWPMTRLSQAAPTRGGARAVRGDLVVVLIPLQAVIWPQAILPAGWAPLSIAALAALCASWTLLVGGVLAIALGGPRVDHPSRRPSAGWASLWMLTLVVLVMAAPLASLLTWREGRLPDIRAEWLLSPVSGVFELTRNRVYTSLAPVLTALHWALIAAPAVLGALLWSIAAARDNHRAGRMAAR